MASLGKEIRLNRIFGKDNKAFIVAFDHGLSGITSGIEDIFNITSIVANNGADGLLLSLGSIKKVGPLLGNKTSLILTIPYDYKYVKLAAMLGVDGIKTAYFGQVPMNDDVFNRLSEIANEAEQWEIPYIIEVVPTDSNGKVLYNVELIKKAARIGAEIGGDVVKTAFAGGVNEYRDIVRSCSVPIVVMGGEKMERAEDALKLISDSISSGAAGGAIGRNVWEYKEPGKIARAISGIIHGKLKLEDAIKII